jgi:chromate transporter
MIYLELFLRFFQTGLFSVGGGLATLPFLYEISNQTHWFSHADIADMIAISESTPGAIGINMSTYAGYITGGIFGGVLATLSLAMPSVIIILIIARLLEKFDNNPYVTKAFYGLRPASTGLIAAAGLSVAVSNLLGDSAFSVNWKGLILAAVLWWLTNKCRQTRKLHPIVFIGLSALAGIVFSMG